jgi:hypothetical protein
VSRGNLEQFVVYFAGHGFVNSYSEHWMLSQAPDNPNEAVSLVESVALARQSAIPNVVFISDACRSRSDSLRTERVRGSLIFPNSRSAAATPSDVDQFLATLVGDASWEVPVTESAGAYEGVFTSAFLDAYRRPDATMVRTVDGKPVVPNSQLKGYLAREVPRRAQAVSIRLNQRPDSQVMSGDSTYIGHAAVPAPVGAVPTPATRPAAIEPGRAPAPPAAKPAAWPALAQPTMREVAGAQLQRAGVPTGAIESGRPSDEALSRAARSSGFDSARDTIAQARGLPAQVAAGCGFAVSGQRLQAVVGGPPLRTDFANAAEGRPPSALVEVARLPEGRPASVALVFADGTGTVLAALDGFIGNVVVDGGGVSSVSYLPARSNWRFDAYAHNEGQIGELHALVATAARFGVFRIEGPRETRGRAAAGLADRIRVLKGIDPTLGIYAAYAYADAGIAEQVRSVMNYMRDDLRADLFDVALLAGALSGRAPGDPNGPVPLLPMLSQGWGLLRVKDVRLPPPLLAAQDQLRPALWTTLGPVGMRLVAEALRTGRWR